jgi:hypothetical protein
VHLQRLLIQTFKVQVKDQPLYANPTSTKLVYCRYKTQQFNSVASQTSGSLLLLAAISILIPTAAQQLGTGGGPAEKALDALIGDPMPLDKV